jgi:hypothetical protein
MDDSPRVQALRLALAATYPDSTAACNELLTEIGSCRLDQQVSFLVVSSENQRSSRFSQVELVGVKCTTKRGWAVSQRFTDGVLYVKALASTAGA